MADKKKKEKSSEDVCTEEQNQPDKKTEKNVSCENKENENDELKEARDKFIRLAADFDNYKKRTTAEKEGLRALVISDTISEILPIIDNLERALASSNEKTPLRDGVQMVLDQAKTSFNNLGVKAYGERGDEFDPNIHNAVMTCEDDELDTNKISEVLQKGYKINDKIIRHALVRVVK